MHSKSLWEDISGLQIFEHLINFYHMHNNVKNPKIFIVFFPTFYCRLMNIANCLLNNIYIKANFGGFLSVATASVRTLYYHRFLTPISYSVHGFLQLVSEGISAVD